jgi:hypothetical protein
MFVMLREVKASLPGLRGWGRDSYARNDTTLELRMAADKNYFDESSSHLRYSGLPSSIEIEAHSGSS